ncbi:MAG: type IV pili methyl-accepting chemotaxis transducer N-terminal domain-containing protein [Ktedonobacteraceae bacterium]|nr:type IV pili methyl-accepting chemotaxis transducer N-terminal domain-containing protein [Ktedonobacteraceae bacterium]
MVTMRNKSAPTYRLTVLYIIALGMVALLAILGQIVIQLALQQQSSDALVINVAGRQRMLSQKLSKDALALELDTTSTARQKRVEELQAALVLWQHSQVGLQYGDSASGLPGRNSERVIQLFGQIQPHYQAMVGVVQDILVAVSNEQADTHTTHTAILSPLVQTILAHEADYLVGMNAIVSQYQQEAEQRVTALKQTELALLGVTLLVLLLEGLFVFRPAVERLQRSIERADRAEEVTRLEHAIAEQKRQLDIDIEQILKTHVCVANGDFTARAPLTKDHMLWQIASALNNLLTRLQRASRAEQELQQIHMESTRLVEAIRRAKKGEHPHWPLPSGTLLDPIIEEFAHTSTPRS